MNNKDFSKTMLIIGAGAHVPYKYPTARQLTDLLKSLHRDGQPVSIVSDIHYSHANEINKHKIKICGYIMSQELISPPKKRTSMNDYDIIVGRALEDFLIEFGQSQVYSIDSYLANYMQRPKESLNKIIPNIGKILIAYFIKSFENRIPVGFHEFDWIQYIINEHFKNKESLEEFFKSPPHIYSFNYDNHFEKCLYFHLTSYHGYSKEDAKEKVNSLKINHIYGHINSLNIEIENTIIANSQADLLVMGEERNKENLDEISKKISNSMKTVDEVYFLGFGFDELNTELIFRHCKRDEIIKNHPKFYSTNIGLSGLTMNSIDKVSPIKIEFYRNLDVNCLELISKLNPIFEKRTLEILMPIGIQKQ